MDEGEIETVADEFAEMEGAEADAEPVDEAECDAEEDADTERV